MKRIDFIKSLFIAPILIKQIIETPLQINSLDGPFPPSSYFSWVEDITENSFRHNMSMYYKITYPNGARKYITAEGKNTEELIEKMNEKLKLI